MQNKIKEESKYIICPKCKGSGQEEKRTTLYDSESVPCSYCGGKRVIIEMTTVTHRSV